MLDKKIRVCLENSPWLVFIVYDKSCMKEQKFGIYILRINQDGVGFKRLMRFTVEITHKGCIDNNANVAYKTMHSLCSRQF